MKKPQYLTKKDTIALVAPSFGCTTEPYKTRLITAINNLNRLGYKIDLGENCFKADLPYASTTGILRANEFMKAYESQASTIISVGGGEVMGEILPYIDFEKIKQLPPKWFMGFSDNTNLTYTLTTIAHVETIYGVNACDFAFYPFKLATKDTYNLLTGKLTKLEGYKRFEHDKIKDPNNPLQPLNLNKKKIITPTTNTSTVSGRLLGGCLDVLQTLCGTKYDKTKEFINEYKEPIIWFLEACDLSPLGIKRAIFQLKEAGWFNSAGCFLIGRSLCMDQELFGVDAHSAYDLLKEFNVPVYLDVDLGHMSPSMPLVCGRCATVEYVDKTKLIITYNE